jgi:hypothetical protein
MTRQAEIDRPATSSVHIAARIGGAFLTHRNNPDVPFARGHWSWQEADSCLCRHKEAFKRLL